MESSSSAWRDPTWTRAMGHVGGRGWPSLPGSNPRPATECYTPRRAEAFALVGRRAHSRAKDYPLEHGLSAFLCQVGRTSGVTIWPVIGHTRSDQIAACARSPTTARSRTQTELPAVRCQVRARSGRFTSLSHLIPRTP